jgi:hypothetical protein
MLGAEGFGNERIDELADDFVTGRIGEGTAQFINSAIATDPSVWTPKRASEAGVPGRLAMRS